MDFIQTLHSLEEAVYEIVTWVLFLPKTLIKVFFRPDWIHGYVTAEFDKEPAERFQDYLSPILFWLIVAVVPYAATVLSTGQLQAQVPTTSILVQVTLMLMAVPAWFAFILLKLKKLPLDRTGLKRLLYMQSFPVAIFELAMLPSVLSLLSIHGLGAALGFTALVVIQYGGFAWFLLAEIILFKQELDLRWWKAVLEGALATVIGAIVFFVALVAYYVLPTLLKMKPS